MSNINGDYIRESDIWLNGKFDISKAMVDLIVLADGEEMNKSVRFLAERWGCSRTKAGNMIKTLVDCGFIKPKKKEPEKEPPITCYVIDSNSVFLKKKKPEKEPPQKDKKKSILPRAIEIFDKGYLKMFGTKYIWDTKNSVCVGKIIEKLRKKIDTSEIGIMDDDSILESFKAFLNIAAKDRWMRENFSVTMLTSKFNEIFSKYYERNGGDKKSELDALARAANEVLAKHAGSDIH